MSGPVTPKDKPNALSLGVSIQSTTYPFRNQFLTLRQDKLIWPDGQTGSYSYVEIKPAVLIVPVTTTRAVVLINQYRYTVDDWVWEIPAGGSHDFEGDDLMDLARRELKEEIGGEAEDMTYVGVFHPAIGKVDADFHVYLATGVTLGQAAPESGEMIQVHSFSIDEALEMARDGTMASSSDAYALLRCEPRLRELEGL
jgi:ADP-ribose pyrophosphatase